MEVIEALDLGGILVALLLFGALLYLGLEIRRLHDELQPLIDSPLVTALSAQP